MRAGERITAIDETVHRGVVETTYGADSLPAGYFRWAPVLSTSLGNVYGATRVFREDREGLSWIRGWHAEDSDDVRAMLAASLLEASAAGGGMRMVFDKNTVTPALRGVSLPVREDGTVAFPVQPTAEDTMYMTFPLENTDTLTALTEASMRAAVVRQSIVGTSVCLSGSQGPAGATGIPSNSTPPSTS